MARAARIAIIMLVAATGCWKRTADYCASSADCLHGTCDLRVLRCVSTDGGGDAADGGDAGDAGGGGDGGDAGETALRCTPASCTGTAPVCDTVSYACRACAVNADCKGGGTGDADGGADDGGDASVVVSVTPVCAPSGACVECLANTDCGGTTPVCNPATNTCRACTADTECAGEPGLCMADGHCATADEVVYVEFNSAGCPLEDGSNAHPFCAPNSAVAAMTTYRHVIIIRGSAGDRMTLNTTSLLPIVIGRKNAGGINASIPATAATAVAVSSDSVVIRDLEVNAGTTSTSKGIVASGAGTKLTLVNVTAKLGTGLGVAANDNATLTMDHASVANNSAGGIFIDGAAFDIRNTTVTSNGPGMLGLATWGGILVNNPPVDGPAKLDYVTVQSNPVGVSCSGPITGTNVSVSGSASGVDVTTTCGFVSCGAPSATCGAQP